MTIENLKKGIELWGKSVFVKKAIKIEYPKI